MLTPPGEEKDYEQVEDLERREHAAGWGGRRRSSAAEPLESTGQL